MSTKYNIYIICKNEEIFLQKSRVLNDKHKGKICHIQWVPAEYLTLTQCNQKMLNKLKTIYNTKQKSIIAKLGCIAAHRKALLAIYSNQTNKKVLILGEHEKVDIVSIICMLNFFLCHRMIRWFPQLMSRAFGLPILSRVSKRP